MKDVSAATNEEIVGKCEHREQAERCRKCKRLDEAWNDLGSTLIEMGEEEPGW